MKSIKELKRVLKEHQKEIQRDFKVKRLALFGSYIRGEQSKKSDLDVLVEFREPVGFEFIHLADYLQDLLGVKIDLVTKAALKPNRWKYISKELRYV